MDNIVTLDKIYITAANNANTLFDYGQLINKDWLMKQFAIKEPKTGTAKDFQNIAFEFMQNFDKFRTHLLVEHKKCLRSVRGQGYEVIHPTSQTDFAMVSLRKDVKTSIEKAIDILSYVNEDLLSLEQIKHRDEQTGKIAALAAFSKQRFLG